MKEEKIKTVAIDFDGVICEYTGWKGMPTFGEPIKGASYAISELRSRGWKVIVWTNRADIDGVKDWLEDSMIKVDAINENPWAPANVVKSRKITADVYIDDKALKFNGDWSRSLQKTLRFKEWWRDEPILYEKEENFKSEYFSAPDKLPTINSEYFSAPDKLPTIKDMDMSTPTVVERPTIPFTLHGLSADQIAFFVEDTEKTLEHYQQMGYAEWVVDEVEAYVRYNKDSRRNIFAPIEKFKVRLCFNYEIMPCEFEILQLLEGGTPQLMSDAKFGLSHLGFHVDDIPQAVSSLESKGYGLMAYIETMKHSTAPSRYVYAYVDTSVLGFITKLINKRTWA
jgi:hypothetical protein